MKTIKLLLVDDDPKVRRGLRMRLELEPDVEVVGEAGDGSAAIEVARRLAPDVIVMDVEMPVMDGITATREVRASSPAAVVVLSMHDDPAIASRARAAGAAAFVAKHCMDGVLVDAIRRASEERRTCRE